MNKFSINKFQRHAQSGFTLIELVVVMVILGILAATALPKFADLGTDARVAKMKAAQGSIAAAAAIYHSAWLAKGGDSTKTTGIIADVTGNGTGYPVAAAGGINVAAGLAAADYPTTATAGVFTADSVASRSGCSVTYTESTGTVAIGASDSTCD